MAIVGSFLDNNKFTAIDMNEDVENHSNWADRLSIILKLVSIKNYSEAVKQYRVLQPDSITIREALKVARAFRLIHEFEDEILVLSAAIERMTEEPRTDEKVQEKLIRAIAKAYSRAERWSEAAVFWRELLNLGFAGRSDLYALIGSTTKSDQSTGLLKLVEKYPEDFGAHLTDEEIEALTQYNCHTVKLKPGLYIVGGGNGTGKSAVGRFLEAVGHVVIDGDTQIAEYNIGHEWQKSRFDFGDHAAAAKFSWPRRSIEKYRDMALSLNRAVFIVGWAHNAWKVLDIGRLGFWLRVPLDVRITRLRAREPKRWADGAPEYSSLVKRHNLTGEAFGAKDMIVLDGTKPVAEVSRRIIDNLVCHNVAR